MIKNIVLIDGLNRSGKNALVDIITSLKRSESIEMNYILEHIVEGIALKKINMEFAKAFFSKFFLEITYNKFLGRNSNFRKNDKSSIFRFANSNLYKKRILQKDGEHIFLKIKKSQNFFPFMTHEIFSNIDIFDKLKLDFKMIAVFRNPYHILYSWHQKKLVKKFGEKNFTLSFKKKGKNIPWYVYGHEKNYKKLNDLNKAAFIIYKLINNSIKKYSRIKDKKKFLFIKYENFVENPFKDLKKICKFLKTSYGKKTRLKATQSGLPLKINKKKSDYKEIFLKRRLSKNLFNKLKILEKKYNKNLYGLK